MTTAMTTISPNFEAPIMVPAGDVTFAVYECGPADGVPLVLLHGWPELAYTWKHVAPALAAAGYRVIMPDMIGFGRSSCPLDKDQYHMGVLTDNLARLLDGLKLEKAIFIGHDWGSATVWPMAYRHKDRVQGVIGICVPHTARPPVEPLKIFEKRFTDKHYFIQFQDEHLPDAVFGGQEEKFFEFIFREPVPRSVWPKVLPAMSWLPDQFKAFDGLKGKKNVIPSRDRAVFTAAYEKTGHQACTNYYRNVDKNWEIAAGQDLTVSQPCFMIGADLDALCPTELMDGMEYLCPDLEKTVISECGHWVTWEQPETLNALMLDWLKRRFPV